MRTIDPDPKKLPVVFAGIPKGRPIVMINLLRFRKNAAYRDASISRSGRQAYDIYAQTALQMVRRVGGDAVWQGRVHGCVIAPDGEDWDEALLVRYPSIEAFMEMLAIPEYKKATIHRTAALEDSRLIATTERVIG